ncbi:efflux RND transporter periplasmic adaptor subunit [Algoriphagus halophilus]|uniref:Membrane fusion protein, multidrug efflux system n=1 Tax=Algoriphagus halophilus TaxID=226505 RepID=A0A1N6DNB0_9BACT|nr:efflux RND transporter periplasmic adaptor subunit [Algoriphagus halophilus]SIN72298.1 membrane fusion protein, multidrug efflux system [Algoriphagus halophilus]
MKSIFTERKLKISFKGWIVFSALSLLSLSSCGDGEGNRRKKNKPLSIPIMELTSRSIEVPQTYVCDIQAVQFVEVRAKVEGFVEEIYVDEGEEVKKGQALFKLNSAELGEVVNSSKALLMKERAEAQAAKLEVERLQILVDKNIITDSELELAKAKLEMAESGILQAESMLKNAQTGLSYSIIKAPFDGIVDRIPFKTGSLVTPGDLMTHITDISEIFAYYKVTENEYLRYMRERQEKGEEFTEKEITLVLSDGQEYPYKGKLETMEADFERGTGSIAFRVRFPNPDGLIKHGASGKVMMTNEMEDVFLIPQKSSFEIQEYTYVYILDSDNTVKVRSFKPIRRFGLFYVADGFQPGDRIIYEGIQQVKDGSLIEPVQVSDQEAYDTLYHSL